MAKVNKNWPRVANENDIENVAKDSDYVEDLRTVVKLARAMLEAMRKEKYTSSKTKSEVARKRLEAFLKGKLVSVD